MSDRALIIRPERPDDAAAITALITAAFGQAAEADLVRRLRADGSLAVSLLAVEDGEAVGHVALSPVTVDHVDGAGRWLGLAPLAVRPDRQRQGIGGRLVEAALDVAEASGASVVFVLGEPAYYGRFGFRPAAGFGWRCSYEVPAEAFRARCFHGAAPLPSPGLVLYAEVFAKVA